jgi:cytochrome c553
MGTKKRVLVGIGLVAVAGLALAAPTVIDLVRLQSYIDESTAAYEADGGPWPHLSDACTGCHGVQGRSQHQGYPSLAGQPAGYLATQLHRFASGERDNSNMAPLAMSLTEGQITQLADYFARHPAGANATFEPSADLREKGRQLVATRGCAACHGETMMGHDAFPRLAAQGHDYLVAQLDAFATGTRRDPTGAMNAMLGSVSAQEREAIAVYLASLAPTTK